MLSVLWPFTFLVLEPVSQRLLVLAEEAREEEEEKEKGEKGDEAHELLYRWGVLNMIRACFPLVGVGCGFWAVFGGGR